jgi:hypothetical protein
MTASTIADPRGVAGARAASTNERETEGVIPARVLTFGLNKRARSLCSAPFC